MRKWVEDECKLEVHRNKKTGQLGVAIFQGYKMTRGNRQSTENVKTTEHDSAEGAKEEHDKAALKLKIKTHTQECNYRL